MYDQNDIVLIPFPYTDLTGTKLRPAIIISNNKLNHTEDRLCCLITSKPSKEGILIKKEDYKLGELPFKSWIKPHRVFTINTRIIKKKLCKINKEFHNEIISSLNKIIS